MILASVLCSGFEDALMLWVYSKMRHADESLISDAKVIAVIILLLRWNRTETLKSLIVIDRERKSRRVLFM